MNESGPTTRKSLQNTSVSRSTLWHFAPIVVFIAAWIVWAVIANRPNNSATKTVRCGKLEIVNKDGEVVAHCGTEEKHGVLHIMDPEESTSVKITPISYAFSEDGKFSSQFSRESLTLHGSGGLPLIRLSSNERGARMIMVDENGKRPALAIHIEDGQSHMTFGYSNIEYQLAVDEKGIAGITIKDGDERSRLLIYVTEEEQGMEIRSKDGNIEWAAPPNKPNDRKQNK